MTPFNPSKSAFGRHETFPLRFGWLTKGYRAWCENPEVFGQDDPTVVLGVGKNMVTAIRYWLEAAQIVESSQAKSFAPTEIGRALFSGSTGWDPFLEDDATLWLIHWLIASNPSEATTFYWFFNRYHKPEFTSAELAEALADFVQESVKSRAAETTLKHDINVLLRMYGPPEKIKGAPVEEGLDSPMTTLGLLQRAGDGKHFMAKVSERRRLPLAAFGYAVLEVMESLNQPSVSVERLLRADNQISTPGSVFRLTEDGLITKLEELVRWLPGALELRETAGIHQLYQMQRFTKYEVIRKYYTGTCLEKAA
jgi:hypothetical protein